MKEARKWGGVVASAIVLSVAAAGCDESPSGPTSRPRGVVDAALVANVPPRGAKAVFYKFGPPDSKIAFTGAKVTKNHEGSFGSFEGTIGLVNRDPVMSAVQVSLDVGSLTTDAPKLTTHLKGADFFDAAQFPKATFSSSSIRPSDAGTYNVTGKLALHGVSKPLTFPAAIRVSPEQVDADAELKINRKDFGIVYPGMPDDLISDEVVIKLTIRAKPAPSEPAKPEGGPPDAPPAD